jgi:hypothetical protein
VGEIVMPKGKGYPGIKKVVKSSGKKSAMRKGKSKAGKKK